MCTAAIAVGPPPRGYRIMNKHMIVAVVLAVVTPALAGDDPLAQWGQWRGPLGSGVAPLGQPPLTWSEDSNVRWKTAIPGKGHSTPIIWGDRVYITSAIPFGEKLAPHAEHAHGAHDNEPAERRYEFVLMAISRSRGTILWQRTLSKQRPHQSSHLSGSWASNSAVTDGQYVIVSFGSRGVFCLDKDGKLLWQSDLGDMQIKHGHGEGSSLALHGNTVIINWDHEGQSFVVALDKKTGTQRWKTARDEGTSWSTPLIVEHAGKSQVIIAATNRVRAYDLSTGAVIWQCGGLSDNVVASPVAGDGFVYVGSSYEKRAMLAIRLADAKGDITHSDAVAWRRDRDTPYVPSPLLYGDRLYFLKHYQGILTCVQAKTGAPIFGPVRLPGIKNVYASIVGAADRVYIVDRSGNTVVIRHGSSHNVLALNHLNDSFSASPAIVGRELYLRGEQFLYCIAESTPSN